MDQREAYTRLLAKAESSRGFSRRILERRLNWWNSPYDPSDWHFYPDLMSKLRLRMTTRHRDDAKELWKRHQPWQRLLINKWNSREFVQRHDIPVPELYWYGRLLNNLPWQNLPDRYVIKPVWGAGNKGVHVVADGHVLLGGGPAGSESVRQSLVSERGIFNMVPLLLEEAILHEDDPSRLPPEYKCYMFGREIGAIQIIDRGPDNTDFRTRLYDQDWSPFRKRMRQNCAQLPLQEPPLFLDSLLSWARKLGTDIGTFMRVDFFGIGERCVFNEFSSTPGTRNNSPIFDETFEELWQTHLPDEN